MIFTFEPTSKRRTGRAHRRQTPPSFQAQIMLFHKEHPITAKGVWALYRSQLSLIGVPPWNFPWLVSPPAEPCHPAADALEEFPQYSQLCCRFVIQLWCFKSSLKNVIPPCWLDIVVKACLKAQSRPGVPHRDVVIVTLSSLGSPSQGADLSLLP